MSLFTKLGNDIASPVDASGAPRPVENGDMQRWMTEVERILAAYQAGGGIVFPDLSTANASLAYNANQMAWVMGDPTPANNGVYRKIGASGTGSWARMGDLPFAMIPLANAGAGTADAIVATSSLPLPTTPGAALLTVNILADNTGNVTINGKPLRTNSGNEIAAGGLTAGSLPAFLDLGDHFRLLSDQASAAIVSAAEAAQLAAEAARDQAEAIVGFDGTAATVGFDGMASGLSATDVQEAIDEVVASIGNGWMVASRAWAIANYHPVAAPDALRTAGYSAAGDGGGALYKKVVTEPAHAGKLSITLADGTTVVWYEIAESILTERMFGAPCDGEFDADTAVGTDATTALQAWADCPVSKRKRFTGVSRVTEGIEFMPGDFIEGDGLHVGITGKQISSFTKPALVNSSGSISQISDLGADAFKGDTKLTLVDTDGLRAGDRICIYDPTNGSWSTIRPTYRKSEWVTIQRVVSSTVVNLMEPLYDTYDDSVVDLYLMRSPGCILQNFRVEVPFLDDKAGIKLDMQIGPVVRNVRADGSQGSCIDIWRSLDVVVDTSAFQSFDITNDNEYGLVLAGVHGAQVRGFFYAQRHGIAIGGSDIVAGCINRRITVYAETGANFNTGSIDMGGHGCSEDCTLVGGTHSGLAFGGKNMRYVNAKFRQGTAQAGGGGGISAYGSEFVGGNFTFDNCEFEHFHNASGDANSPIDIRLRGDATEKCRFYFNNCKFWFHTSSSYGIRIQINGCLFEPSIYVNGGWVRGPGLSQFVRLQRDTGVAKMDAALVLDVEGLGGATAIYNAGTGLTITRQVHRVAA